MGELQLSCGSVRIGCLFWVPSPNAQPLQRSPLTVVKFRETKGTAVVAISVWCMTVYSGMKGTNTVITNLIISLSILTQYYCYVVSHNLFFSPQISGTMLFVRAVSGNVEMDLRKEVANGICKTKLGS